MTEATVAVTINDWKICGLTPSKIQATKLAKLTAAGKLRPHDLRVTLGVRMPIVVDYKERTITFWKLNVQPAYSEYIYEILDSELRFPERPDIQNILQNKSGHRAPIVVEPKKLAVSFYRF